MKREAWNRIVDQSKAHKQLRRREKTNEYGRKESFNKTILSIKRNCGRIDAEASKIPVYFPLSVDLVSQKR